MSTETLTLKIPIMALGKLNRLDLLAKKCNPTINT
jgi:hypothetical protein